MFPALNFPLRRLALMIAAAYAPSSFALQAGRIDFTTGEPVGINRQGQERLLHKGDSIEVGDRISTRTGRAQIAFTDGSYVSLQPNTDFGVDEYNFKGKTDGTEKGFFSLLKGALRTVTGIIGRGERDAYSMRTPTATIGIRGTGGLIEVTPQGTLVKGTSGIWVMRTRGGSLDVPAGKSGFAGTEEDKAPSLTSITPNTPPNALSEMGLLNGLLSGEQAGIIGMADGTGYRVNYVTTTSSPPNLLNTTSTSATFNSRIALASWNGTTNTLGGGSVVDAGNDGLIGWGRWIGTVTIGTSQTFASDKGMHYVVGIPTASMPTTGTATYTLLGGTTPTWSMTAGTGTLNSASMTVNFGSSTLDYNLSVTMGTPVYTISQTGLSFAGSSFNGSPNVTATGGACSSPCSGSVTGFFTGASADRAGMNYSVTDGANSFIGAAALTR